MPTHLEIVKNYIDATVDCLTKLPKEPTNQLTEAERAIVDRYTWAKMSLDIAIESERRENAARALGLSSKDREFIELQKREQKARAMGYTRNDYVCVDCLAEGKTLGNSTYLDWPASFVNGETRCSQHSRVHDVVMQCERNYAECPGHDWTTAT